MDGIPLTLSLLLAGCLLLAGVEMIGQSFDRKRRLRMLRIAEKAQYDRERFAMIGR